MELKTKHRIIGIVVLVALAVIVVPLFFSRSTSATNGANLSAHVPNPPGKPEIEQIAIPVQSVGTAAKPANVPPADDLATQPLQANPVANNDAAPVDTKTASEEIATHINSVTAAAAVSATPVNNLKPVTPTSNASTADTSLAPAAPVEEAATSNSAAPKTMPAPPAIDGQKSIAPPANTSPINNRQENNRNKTGAVKRRFAEESTPAPAAKHSLTPKIESAKLKDAWTIQLGSFTEKKNAESLVKELRAKGYAAYLHEGKSEGGKVSRVYIGPELKRERADAMVKKLKETLNLKAVVVKYTV